MALKSFALVAQLVYVGLAQIYELKKTKAPANKSLQTIHAFYVFSREDAPERAFGQPYVKFHRLKATVGASPPPASFDPATYTGIQLSIMRYADFWKLINPKDFCCSWNDVQDGKCEKQDQLLLQKPLGKADGDLDFYSVPVGFGNEPAKDVKMSVKDTGVYVLVYSNCGELADATVSGEVTVKNVYGFLPGNEYQKMPFYGWLLLVYLALAAIWTVLLIRWWRERQYIQTAISVVIALGFVECCLWYFLLHDWNASGHRRQWLFLCCIMSSVVKSILSYMLVLVASLGWGVTRPFLGLDVSLRIGAITVAYIVLDFARELVLSFRHSTTLPTTFVVLCLLPVSLVNGGVFYWVFTSLADLMEILKDRRQLEKLSLFSCLSKILITAVVVATGALVFQIFEVSQNMDGRWAFEWIFADALPHVIFLVVLVAMMYLWAPHKYSQRYALEAREVTDVDGAGDVWHKEGLIAEQTDGVVFWADKLTDGGAKDTDLVDVLGTSGAARGGTELAQF